MSKIIEEKYNWKATPTHRASTEYIILHHASGGPFSAQDIHRMHQNRKDDPFIGIGYHFYVRKDGGIYRGRPLDTIGAHCQGSNHNSIGICAEGNYEVEQMPQVQQQAITELVAELKRIYPKAQVVGHKEKQANACPGKNYPLAEIKAGRRPVTTPKVIIGNNILEAVLVDGRTYAPVRALVEALGREVTWDQDTMTATVK